VGDLSVDGYMNLVVESFGRGILVDSAVHVGISVICPGVDLGVLNTTSGVGYATYTVGYVLFD
jgi:hypothetical protein